MSQIHNKKAHKQDNLFKFSFDKCDAKYKVKHAGDCGNKMYPCDICGKILVDQTGLSNQKQVIHNSNYGNCMVVMCVEDALQKYPCKTIFRL